MGLRLALFALLLLPAFLRVGWAYVFDARVHHGIRFGPNRRNFLDIYCPAEAARARAGSGPAVPVVVAIMGGAWVLGYRAWNAQLGQRLMDAGVLVVAVDYRNLPRGNVPDMVEDLDRGLAWVFASIKDYGGDPGNVVVTGQSAGAHLSALLLAQRGLDEARAQAADPEQGGRGALTASWSVRDIRGYVGVSGPYDLERLGAHLERRGLSAARPLLLNRICPGADLQAFSPLQLVQSAEWSQAALRGSLHMPPVLLFHGEADKTVPARSSRDFGEALQAAGVADVTVDVRPGLAHAEPIIEGPFRGEDHQVQLLLPFLFGNAAQERLSSLPPLRPLYPRCIINLASRVMPF